MKKVLFAMVLMSIGTMAHAASCADKAAEKKLSGAAKTSFVTKCEKDSKAGAKATCDTQATERKLSGAARTSFVNKCQRDSAG